jgi:hypothetical protein
VDPRIQIPNSRHGSGDSEPDPHQNITSPDTGRCTTKTFSQPVLPIRDVYPGSDFFPSRVRIVSMPGSNCLHAGSRIRIKEFKHFNPKKWFLSSRKYDPGCSSRIRITDPDPGVKKAPDPGSATLKPTTLYLKLLENPVLELEDRRVWAHVPGLLEGAAADVQLVDLVPHAHAPRCHIHPESGLIVRCRIRGNKSSRLLHLWVNISQRITLLYSALLSTGKITQLVQSKNYGESTK